MTSSPTTRTCKRKVILGPPGTGKTSRLLVEARDLAGEDESKVALVSHTRIAAKELSDRCEMPKATASTLHSLCYHALGLAKSQVVTPQKLKKFGEMVGMDFNMHGEGPGDVFAIYERARATNTPIEEVFEQSARPCTFSDLRYVVSAYELWKHRSGLRDYTDMLMGVFASGAQLPYTKLFLDEAQDLTPLQWRVIDNNFNMADVVVVAGDDDQAIYEWNGAWPHGMENFINLYDAEVTVLSRSHRVPRTVHAAAGGILEKIKDRLHKKYLPREAEGSVTMIGAIESMRPEEIKGSTILYRDRSQLGSITDKLMSAFMTWSTPRRDKGPYDSRWGRALRTLDAWQRNCPVPDKEVKNLEAALLPAAWAFLEKHGAESFKDRYPSEYLTVPSQWAHYFDRVDMTKPPEVTVSTIHGFKGAESDRIILLTSTSQRVSEGYVKNPDAERRVFYVGYTRAKEQLVLVGGNNEILL